MGMSSSQARLLHLTSRMHQIEYKAQKLEAQKLQLANDSRRVYDDYLRVLDSQKVQFSTLNPDGSITFLDATLAALENRTVDTYNGATAGKTYLLQDAETGTIYLTKSFADKYGFEGTDPDIANLTLEQYIEKHKEEIPTRDKTIEVDDYKNVISNSLKPVANNKIREYDPEHITGTTWVYEGGGINPARLEDDNRTCSITGNITPATSDTKYTTINNLGEIMVKEPKESYQQVIVGGTKVNNATSVTLNNSDTKTYLLSGTYNKYLSKVFTFGYGGSLNGKGQYIYGTHITNPQMTFDELSMLEFGYNFANVNNTSYVYKEYRFDGNGNVDYSTIKNIDLKDIFNGNNTLQDFIDYAEANFGVEEYNEESNVGFRTNSLVAITTTGIAMCLNPLNGLIREYDTCTLDTDTTLLGYASSTNKEWKFEFKDNNGNYVNIDYSNLLSSKEQTSITYGDYFQYVQNYFNTNHPEAGFTWNNNDGLIQLNINNGWTIETPGNLSAQEENVTTHTIIGNDLARNIYIVNSIVNEQDADEFHPEDASTVMMYDRDNASKRIIVMINDALNTLLNQSEPNREALEYMTTAFGRYVSGVSGYTGAEVISKLEEYGLIDENNYPTTDIYEIDLESTGHNLTTVAGNASQATVEKGYVALVPTDSDMREYFAYEMANSSNATKDYQGYLNDLNEMPYSNYQLADLYYNAQTNKNAVIEALKSGNISNYTQHVANWEMSDYYTFVQDTFDKFRVTSNKEVYTNTADDILKQITHDIYVRYPQVANNYASPQDYLNNYLKNTVGLTDIRELASLSSHYGQPTWDNILEAIYNNNSLSNWNDMYDNTYSVSYYDNTGNIEFQPASQFVLMDSVSNIARRLAADVYTKDTTQNAEEIENTISNFSTRTLASLSSYYGPNSSWNSIIDALYTNLSEDSVSNWSNVFGDNLAFVPNNVSEGITREEQISTAPLKGILNIPKTDGIASNLLEAFRQLGKDEDRSLTLGEIAAKLNGKDLETLANINEYTVGYLTSKSNALTMGNIYEYLMNNGTLSMSKIWDASKYDIQQNIEGTCEVEYKKIRITDPNGNGEKEMDTDSEKYKQLVRIYNTTKALGNNGVIVIDDNDKRANSYEFIANFANSNRGVYIEFDPDKYTDSESIKKMAQTNISVETKLREVSDEKDLKKAEAKYEADMRQIDKKDRKYDTELAALETERNATKNEMETLKTVAKENVDRTFKLFG